MSRPVILLCAALVGCNDILGLGGDFTVDEPATASGETVGAQASTSSTGEGAPSATSGDATAAQGPGSGGGSSDGGGAQGTGSQGVGAQGTGTQGVGGGTGGAEPVEATCEEYCDTIEANCTNANAEYGTNICPVMCEYMAKGHVGDTSGDTVGCRLGKAVRAADDPVTYCQQAGPLGVDGCAEPCEAFCTLLFATCFPHENVPFDSYPACVEACGEIDYLRLDEGGSDFQTLTGDNLNCWLYHLQVANASPESYGHCNHIGHGPTSQCVD